VSGVWVEAWTVAGETFSVTASGCATPAPAMAGPPGQAKATTMAQSPSRARDRHMPVTCPPAGLMAYSSEAPAGPLIRVYSSGVSQSTPSGGTVITADASRPCHGSSTASTPPRLPVPLPPYTIASVLMTSRQRPAAGRPIR
jgi:hypothetical protein